MTDGLGPDGLDRAELISLLEALGHEDDAEALAAARALAGKVGVTGTGWDALLAPGIGAEPEATEADEDAGDVGDNVVALDALPADEAAKNAESLALIDKLLARSGQSEEFRRELEDYKADIAAGEFKDADHTYLRAVYKRLTA